MLYITQTGSTRRGRGFILSFPVSSGYDMVRRPQQGLNNFWQIEPNWDDLPGWDKHTLGMEERDLLLGSF